MSARGFTLIELLISITIIGVVLVLIMGAFRIGINAWEKGEADIGTYQRQQIVLQLVKQQLAAIRPEIKKEDQAPYFFLGNEQTVEFVSDAAVIPGNRFGRVFVKYRIREDGPGDGVSLEIYEKSLASGQGNSLLEPMGEAFHLLLEDMAAIRFEFLLQDADAPPEWLRDWDPQALEVKLPDAVRVTLQAEKGGAAVRIVGRIASELLDN